jgi:hypothetical protein
MYALALFYFIFPYPVTDLNIIKDAIIVSPFVFSALLNGEEWCNAMHNKVIVFKPCEYVFQK